MHISIASLHKPSKLTGVCRYAANLARYLVDMEKVSRVTLVIGQQQKHYEQKSRIY